MARLIQHGETKMKVGELIKALSSLPQDIDVFIWDAGDRLGVESIDDSFVEEDKFVDINTDRDMRGY